MAADTDSVLNQADALMRRHRSFVARDGNTPAAPSEPEDLPDIPVLTEKVGADATLDLHAELQAALQAELDRWLADALPQQIETLKTQLGELLQAHLDTALRDALLPRLAAALKDGADRHRPGLPPV